MARQVIPRLPPRLEYPDLPPFADNCDNVATRTISAAWNALFTTELTDFSYLAFAREVGVSPSALYRYYPNISVLAGQLAVYAMTALIAGLSDGFPYEAQLQASLSPHDRTRLIVRNYLAFVQKRPRHYALAVSAQYAGHEAVRAKKDYLRDILHRVLGMELGRRATPAETHGFWSLLHGSASLIAAGEPPETEHVVAMLDRYFDFLRAAGAALP